MDDWMRGVGRTFDSRAHRAAAGSESTPRRQAAGSSTLARDGGLGGLPLGRRQSALQEGSNVNPLTGFSRQSVVKLHQVCAPQELGVPSYSGRKVRVRSETMKNLKTASDVLMEVKHMMPFGAGNQIADIVQTQGESWARASMARVTAGRNSSVMEYGQAGMQAQGGACNEHASVAFVALASREINAPITRVKDSRIDHAYALIGDPRDPRWGESDTVVVDPWARYPSACTLAETGMHHTPSSAHSQVPPRCGPIPEAVALMQGVQQASRAEVDRMLADNGLPPVGNSLLRHLNRNVLGTSLHAYDNRIAARDPSVKYTDGSLLGGKTMDKMALSQVNRQKEAQRMLDERRG
ncbi:type III effector [Paracidovorax avenae]|uniref:type III effector n=1 Tax=Paracidovorax avenae TaxID=80867 RepID=UPI001AD830A6|nr:type III effector [Paracidovorax avenae]